MIASIVVPTYRRAALLQQCLERLVAQDLDAGDYEIIVADDASSEATRRQVEAWSRRSKMAIHYIAPSEAHGPAAARNAAIAHSSGDYLALLDADDVWEPEFLARQMAVFAAMPDTVAAGWDSADADRNKFRAFSGQTWR